MNLYGALHLAQAGVTAIRERGGGALVLVNSGAVLLDPPALGAYTTSKAALASLARTLAVEVGQWGIRVNGVFLGGVAGDNILHARGPRPSAPGSPSRTGSSSAPRRSPSAPCRRPTSAPAPCCSSARTWPRP